MRLIDADALKKIWSMADRCEDCPQDTRRCQYEQVFTRMDICEMLDETPTVGGWVSVKDRLPEIQTFVLLCAKHGDAAFTTIGCRRSLVDRTVEKEYTHWMPLPEPPEVKK